MKCDECNKGQLKPKRVPYAVLGVDLGEFDALVCSSCNETIFEVKAMGAIEKAAKDKGVWGISAKTKIGTSGNALDVRIPQNLVEFLHLKKGQEVLIEPIDRKRFQVILA